MTDKMCISYSQGVSVTNPEYFTANIQSFRKISSIKSHKTTVKGICLYMKIYTLKQIVLSKEEEI